MLILVACLSACGGEEEVDLCSDVTCTEGLTCVEGECVEAQEMCGFSICLENEVCIDGVCETDDPCFGIVCSDGKECVLGACVFVDPCDGITCDPGSYCEDGACVLPDPCEGVVCGVTEYCEGGECLCQPVCEDMECGDDGCGGSCGECSGELICDTGLCVDPADCDGNGFEVVSGGITVQQDYLRYQGANAEVYPLDVLQIELYQMNPYLGPKTPGTYSVDGENYVDCGLCLLLHAGCNDQGCQKTFFADEGELEITAIESDGGEFAATYHNVVFKEVTIGDDWVSTPVEGGETWCLNDLSVSEVITVPSMLGETVSTDFEMLNASDEMVNIAELAQGKKALFFIAVAGW